MQQIISQNLLHQARVLCHVM